MYVKIYYFGINVMGTHNFGNSNVKNKYPYEFVAFESVTTISNEEIFF